jgi:hypothetical protein
MAGTAKYGQFHAIGGGRRGPALAHLSGEGDAAMNVDAVADRVRAEFVEMPGLSLTVRQASRLFGLDQDVCRVVVDRLVRTDFLRWSPTGAVARGDR